MTIYKYEMPWGETLKIKANLSEASAPIRVEGDEPGTWRSTPYQTADARHREMEMLRLVVQYIGPEWYTDPSSDLSDEEQLDEAVDGAEVIEEED
jgi:hypothetical protein